MFYEYGGYTPVDIWPFCFRGALQIRNSKYYVFYYSLVFSYILCTGRSTSNSSF